MKLNVTGKQLESIVNLKDDATAMLGCGESDEFWIEWISDIERMIKNNKKETQEQEFDSWYSVDSKKREHEEVIDEILKRYFYDVDEIEELEEVDFKKLTLELYHNKHRLEYLWEVYDRVEDDKRTGLETFKFDKYKGVFLYIYQQGLSQVRVKWIIDFIVDFAGFSKTLEGA